MTILDIRTEQEYCSGHLCDAINIPTPLPPLNNSSKNVLRNRLQNWIDNEYRGEKVYVYCKKGIRAELATNVLRSLGVNAVNIGGVETTLKDYKKCHCMK